MVIIDINLIDILGNAVSLCGIRFTPLSAPFGEGGSIVVGAARTILTDVNGNAHVTMEQGNYQVRVLLNGATESYGITVPDGGGPYSLTDLITSGINPLATLTFVPTDVQTNWTGYMEAIANATPPLGAAEIAESTPVNIASDQVVPVSATALPLPEGAATSSAQVASQTLLSSLDSKAPDLVSGRLPIDGSGVIQPVSIESMPTTPVTGVFFQEIQPMSAVSLPLPIGAATDAGQETIIAAVSSIDTKTPALASGRVPVDGSGATQPVSAVSLPLPEGAATDLGITGASGKTLTDINSTLGSPLQAGGNVSVSNFPPTQPVSVSSLPLPTGAATLAAQTTAQGSLTSIDTKTPSLALGRVPVDGSGVTQPVSVASLPLPAGAATNLGITGASGKTLSDINSTLGSPLQAGGNVSVSNFPPTQPVTVSSLPLPSGAATSVAQTTAQGSLSSIDTKTPSLASGRVPVDGSGVTQPVSAASLPLPAGAATDSGITGASAKTLTDINSTLGSPLQAGGNVSVSNFPPIQPVTVSSLPLPSGAATSSGQTTAQSSLSSIDTKTPSLAGGRVPVDGSGVTQPVSVSVLPLPIGAAQDGSDITNPTSMPVGGVGIRGWLSAIWTKLNGALAVTGNFWQPTQPVSLVTLPSLVAGTALVGSAKLTDGTDMLQVNTDGSINIGVLSVGGVLVPVNGIPTTLVGTTQTDILLTEMLASLKRLENPIAGDGITGSTRVVYGSGAALSTVTSVATVANIGSLGGNTANSFIPDMMYAQWATAIRGRIV